jgi:hypothetical protein
VRALRRWRGGLVVAAVCFVVGTFRLLATGATGWTTGVWFLVAAVYAFVALVARRLAVPERPEDWLGRAERTPRFGALLPALRPDAAGRAGPRVADSNVVARIRYLRADTMESTVKNRLANALVIAAAIVGILLVITSPDQPAEVGPAAPGHSSSATP